MEKMTSEFPYHIDQVSTIINSLTQAVIGISEDGEIEYLNTAAGKIFDYKAKQVMGKNINILIPDIFQPVQNGSKPNTVEKSQSNITCHKKDGTQFNIDLTIKDMSTYSKKQYVLLIKDIPIPKKTKDSLQADFISMMSHELKSPLTSIIGYLDIILDGDTGPLNEEQLEFLDIVSQNAVMLDMALSNLSLISNLERGKIVFDKQRFDLSQLLLKISDSFTENFERKKILFKHAITPGIFFEGDEQLFYSAVANLITNAINYTPEGLVELTTAVANGQINISIKDSGVGISKQDLDRLFTKFFRSGDQYIRESIGSGLSLVSTKKIIEKHNGKIIASSKLGEGAVFTIILPQ